MVLFSIVYFTTNSKTTERFVENINRPLTLLTSSLVYDSPFILTLPTYNGRVIKPVKEFLSNQTNIGNLKGVIGTGNKNFGKDYAIAADIISNRFNVPLIHKVELLGTMEDIDKIHEVLPLLERGKNSL